MRANEYSNLNERERRQLKSIRKEARKIAKTFNVPNERFKPNGIVISPTDLKILKSRNIVK